MQGIDFTLLSLPVYLVIFSLMLGSFLIGYFASSVSASKKSKKQIKKLKNQVNNFRMQNQIKNIETIFTEVKSNIIEEEEDAKIQEESPQNYLSSKEIAERSQNQYVTYTKNKLSISFENIGQSSKKEKDDLTKIDGIGPYIEQKLNDIGIFNYDQISRMEESDIRTVTELIEFFPGRIERDDWVGQANEIKVY